MKQLLAFAILLMALPALASNPGEPLDCSDWVLHEPGLSCVTEMPFPCKIEGTNSYKVGCLFDPGEILTPSGDVFVVEFINDQNSCGTHDIWTTQLIRSRPDGSQSLVASIQDRCIREINEADGVQPGVSYFYFAFDQANGRLVVSYTNRYSGADPQPYQSGKQRIAITGFTTLFDELQSFTPTANEISFRVPYMPEGFQYADYFDTYYGDLATVGDWSQAQPLECGFPASVPSVGDYLTVADTLPALAPGQGRYYVTAANYMGQRRYGRKSSGGVLTGRDPSVLPGCQQ